MGKQATFVIKINLDPIPGTMHTVMSAQEQIQRVLDQTMGHYNPIVTEPEK